MATAASTFTWASYGTALKAYLGVSGSSEDTNLELWLAAAAEDCDDYCGWYWTDEDDELRDETPDTHSNKTKLGIYEWVRAYRSYVLRGAGVRVGVIEIKTGPLKEKYGSGGDDGMMLARQAAAGLWQAGIYDVTLAGRE